MPNSTPRRTSTPAIPSNLAKRTATCCGGCRISTCSVAAAGRITATRRKSAAAADRCSAAPALAALRPSREPVPYRLVPLQKPAGNRLVDGRTAGCAYAGALTSRGSVDLTHAELFLHGRPQALGPGLRVQRSRFGRSGVALESLAPLLGLGGPRLGFESAFLCGARSLFSGLGLRLSDL